MQQNQNPEIDNEIDQMIENELDTSFDQKQGDTLYYFYDQSFKSRHYRNQNLINTNNIKVVYENKYDFSQGRLFHLNHL